MSVFQLPLAPENDTIIINIVNNLDVPTGIHWHGLDQVSNGAYTSATSGYLPSPRSTRTGWTVLSVSCLSFLALARAYPHTRNQSMPDPCEWRQVPI